jgi:hypothetical protein
MNTHTTLPLHFAFDVLVHFAGEKTDRMNSGPRVFHHHHGLEGRFVAGSERVVHLLGRPVNLVEERHAQERRVNPLDQLAAPDNCASTSPPATPANCHGQRHQPPIPVQIGPVPGPAAESSCVMAFGMKINRLSVIVDTVKNSQMMTHAETTAGSTMNTPAKKFRRHRMKYSFNTGSP